MCPVTTRIVGKYQTTVPPEIREIYNLQVGDLLEWTFDKASGEIHLIAKRAQLITPRVRELEDEIEAARNARASKARETATSR
jgi:bifunctional DNA-binding transcriptional regulator/antitoxin component of YhaV-PrlF toxin-antitoxin module